MKKISISTSLVGKHEVFRVLALGYAFKGSLPILLIGDAGVGKSLTISDFLFSVIGNKDKLFNIQLTGQTKPSDLLGRIDMPTFVEHKKMVYNRPICDAEGVFIDEVDKGNGEVRNSMLSIMNEKKIIDGKDECNLVWKLFVGSANTIPTEETGNPFWDRFVIKHEVFPSPINDLFKFMTNTTEPNQIINIPDEEDVVKTMESFDPKHIKILISKIKKGSGNSRQYLSDRTIVKLPRIAAICKYVWELPDNEEAIIMACKLTCPQIVDEMIKELLSAEKKEINNLMNLLKTASSNAQLSKLFIDFEKLKYKCMVDKSVQEQIRIEQEFENRIMNCGNDSVVDKFIATKEKLGEHIDDWASKK